VFTIVQAVGLAGSVTEMNRRGVGECLPTLSAFLLVQFVFVVTIAVVVVYINVRATVWAFRVFAHGSSMPANPAFNADLRKLRLLGPLTKRWRQSVLHIWTQNITVNTSTFRIQRKASHTTKIITV
jgi:hypothetical protein